MKTKSNTFAGYKRMILSRTLKAMTNEQLHASKFLQRLSIQAGAGMQITKQDYARLLFLYLR